MATHVSGATRAGLGGRTRGTRRIATETRYAFRTTEFWAYIAAVAGVLIAAWVVTDGGSGAGDAFNASRAWLYVTILTAGYAVSRGLAKAGSYELDPDADDTTP
jgi:hypothetical protein